MTTTTGAPVSAFAKFEAQAWPYRFRGHMRVGRIAGGIPTDPNVAEGWIRTKLGAQPDDLIRQQVAETMLARNITADEAAEEVAANRHLNGFKRDERGLFIEGRQLKAAIKEAASVAGAAGKVPLKSWGQTRKGLLGFIAEHICVVEEKLYLGVTAEEFVERAEKGEGCGVNQRFVHTWRGTGIQYEEFVDNAEIDFTVWSDWKFTDEQWAMIWLTGGQQGIGATRSQGMGRYVVTEWQQIKV